MCEVFGFRAEEFASVYQTHSGYVRQTLKKKQHLRAMIKKENARAYRNLAKNHTRKRVINLRHVLIGAKSSVAEDMSPPKSSNCEFCWDNTLPKK